MCNCNKITICTEFDAAQIAGLQVPIASIHAFATQTVPADYLICDGSAVSRAEYAELFAALGTVWGEGDGSTTFNIPDLRGEFLRGFDDGRGVDAGRVFASEQEGAFQEHQHKNGMAEDGTNLFVYGASQDDLPGAATGTTDGDGPPITYQGLTSIEGGNETRPRNVAVTYAIKATVPAAA